MQESYGHILTWIPDNKIQTMVCQFLTDIGFTVTQADTMAQTRAHFDKSAPDLVITDIGETNKISEERLSFLSDFSYRYPDVPVITLTTQNQKQVLHSLRLGAWDCIEKPIEDITHLEHAVCKAFERARLINENKLYRHKLEEMNQKLQENLHELKKDQIAGKQVQEQLRPSNDLVINQYHFSHIILPSLYLSGDVVDYFRISSRYTGFYIADVSGHGASSAFVSVIIKTLFDQFLQSYKQNYSDVILHPQRVFEIANKYLLGSKLGKYLTMIYGVLDTELDELTYSIAGHYPYPAYVANNKKVVFLQQQAFAIGMVKEASYKEDKLAFEPGATLAMFSDGLLEIMPGDSLTLKEKLIQQKLTSDVSIASLIDLFNIELDSMRIDDITLLLIHHAANQQQ